MATETEMIRQLLHDRLTSGHSYCPNSLPRAAKYARERARVEAEWDRLEDLGMVQLNIEPDYTVEWDDLVGDMFKEEHADTIPGGMRALKAQEKAYRALVDAEGVWVLVGEYRLVTHLDDNSVCGYGDPCEWVPSVGKMVHYGPWVGKESLGCVVGDQHHPDNDEIVYEIKQNTIDSLRATLKERCPCCRKAG